MSVYPHQPGVCPWIGFHVFGKHFVGVGRRNGVWKPYYLGKEGKRRDADFVIPTDIEESGLDHHLAVLFHVSATPQRHQVVRLTG